MAQSITSQSIVHHTNLNHHTPQNLNSTHHHHHLNHHQPQHNNSIRNNSIHSSSNNQHSLLKSHQDNDEESLARKKKNADAQAAFRQRRQTYIKSLEDTVAELKKAVSEMELIVKTTSQEVKVHRHQVESLQTKLTAYETGEIKPGFFDQQKHCKCCKFATQDSTSRLHTKDDQQTTKPLPTPSTSATTINPPSDYHVSSGPSVLTSPNPTQQETISREWPYRQTIPSIFQINAPSRSTVINHTNQEPSNDSPHSTKSLDYPRNHLHHPSSHPLPHSNYSRSNCDLTVFTSFGAPENSSIPNFYSVSDGDHGVSAHNSSPSGASHPLELGQHPSHLQPILSQSYDRSPPIRQPNSLNATFSPIGPHQSFDSTHHSGTLSSPRIWNSSHHNHHSTGSDPHSGPYLNSSPKPELYSIDPSAADSTSSGFCLNHNNGDNRNIMRSSDYLPSIDIRSVHQSYPMIPSLVSPGTDPNSTPVGLKNRSTIIKRRREWGNEKFDVPHDPREADLQNSIKVNSAGKLNGLPAKVAQCAQVVLEATQSVSQAKEEFQALTTTSSTVIPTSVSPNSTPSNGYTGSPDPSHDNSRFQRMKLNVSNHHSISSTATLAPPQSQRHEDQQTNQSYHR